MVDFLKKNKYMVAGVGMVAVFAVVIGLASVVNAKEAEVSNQVDVIVDDVNALYADETKAMLAEDATMEQVVAIEEKVSEVEGSDSLTEESKEILDVATTDLGYAKQMVELRDMTLELLDDNGVLADGADVAGVQVKADELKKIKPDFVVSIQSTIDEAKKQQDEIVAATKNVNALFTDETKTTVRSDVTRSEYNTTQESVDVVKNKTSKDTLQKSLNAVDSFLDEQEAIAQAEDEKVEQEQSAKSEDTSSSSSSSNLSSDSDSNNSSSNSNSSSSNSSGGSSGSNSNSGSDDIEIPEFEVDYYCVQDGIYPNGDPLPSEVYELEFETEEEMRAYMDKNYPGAVYGYGVVYKEV